MGCSCEKNAVVNHEQINFFIKINNFIFIICIYESRVVKLWPPCQIRLLNVITFGPQSRQTHYWNCHYHTVHVTAKKLNSRMLFWYYDMSIPTWCLFEDFLGNIYLFFFCFFIWNWIVIFAVWRYLLYIWRLVSCSAFAMYLGKTD